MPGSGPETNIQSSGVDFRAEVFFLHQIHSLIASVHRLTISFNSNIQHIRYITGYIF